MKYVLFLLTALYTFKAYAADTLPANPWTAGNASINVSEEYQNNFYADFKNKMNNLFSHAQKEKKDIIITVTPYRNQKTEAAQPPAEKKQKSSPQSDTGLMTMFDNLRSIGYNIPQNESSEMDFTRFLPDNITLPRELSYAIKIKNMVHDFEKNSGLNIHDTIQKIMQ